MTLIRAPFCIHSSQGGFNIGHRPQWLALDGLGDLKHRTGAVIIMVMGAQRLLYACAAES